MAWAEKSSPADSSALKTSGQFTDWDGGTTQWDNGNTQWDNDWAESSKPADGWGEK